MPMELKEVRNGSDHLDATEFAALPLEIIECFVSLVNGWLWAPGQSSFL